MAGFICDIMHVLSALKASAVGRGRGLEGDCGWSLSTGTISRGSGADQEAGSAGMTSHRYHHSALATQLGHTHMHHHEPGTGAGQI